MLQHLGISCIPAYSLGCRSCAMGKTKPGWLKNDVDGSDFGNPGHSRGGGILRDSRGDILSALSSYYGIGSK